MPKMKTNKAAAKRFKKTGSGQLKRDRAFGSHLFANKTTKAKRHLRKAALVSKGDQKRIEQMLTYM
ncbi:50S ribosomal protein L35 [Brevibacillus porteri]|uniref:Large ribosomal subunit protein bL35 n=2 Tax=Brevibacillus TaxID=55080 RepID=A0A517I8Z4_BREBE|nr:MULTISPECIES: 50S ribosomal protein L35 [Brevibacillus]MDC0763597.1 50S ribosomal protein L35 [Brevibacillus sp. AG]MED1800929.1 50S ribosomal protein L35 [Brevibacillus porteri]MED2130315.1 50S ribosomal protein L35 [Brevibacillus porteri]MED2742842.1 50S ribosomal protein L35 [Brevibacillus porteri]MED2817278.1 50S ribosomal protein L35 [Brevibacillus porteri]